MTATVMSPTLMTATKMTGHVPANLILSVIKHFLDRRINTTTTTTTTVPDEATEHIKYISLPFFGPQSEKLKNEILSLFNKYCSHFTIK